MQDISRLIQEGRVHIVKRFNETWVLDSSTNVPVLVYATKNGAMVTYDRVEEPGTGVVQWVDPSQVPLQPLVETGSIVYSPEVIYSLLEKIVEGESLTSICRREDMPRYSQLVRWMKVHPWIKTALEEARVARAEHHRDMVLTEAERAESVKDPLEATKVRIEAHKWAAGMDDGRYKSNAKVEATVNVPTQIIIQTGIDRGNGE